MFLFCENLTKTYTYKKHWYLKSEKKEVFKNLNFTLNKAENLILCGESGCGKSTLAKIICGLESPDSGEIYFKDQTLFSLRNYKNKELKRQIQYIFQDQKLALHPYKKVKTLFKDVYDNFSLSYDEEQILNFLDFFELDSKILSLKPLALSTGQAMRIGIIRALLLEPELLICDEITASLDFLNTAKILSYFKKLKQKQKITFIFITHQNSIFKDFECKILKM